MFGIARERQHLRVAAIKLYDAAARTGPSGVRPGSWVDDATRLPSIGQPCRRRRNTCTWPSLASLRSSHEIWPSVSGFHSLPPPARHPCERGRLPLFSAVYLRTARAVLVRLDTYGIHRRRKSLASRPRHQNRVALRRGVPCARSGVCIRRGPAQRKLAGQAAWPAWVRPWSWGRGHSARWNILHPHALPQRKRAC